jgi:hypothetical protein
MRPLRAAPNGLLTTQDLLGRGFTRKQIDAMVRWAWLVRLHRGVYMVPAPDVLSRAALLAAGQGSALCLESALAHLASGLARPARCTSTSPSAPAGTATSA